MKWVFQTQWFLKVSQLMAVAVNRKRVQRLMRKMRIEAIYPKPKLSRGNENHKIYPYLLKGLKIKRRKQVWGTDIVYIKIGNSFEYLTSVIVTSQ